MNNDIYYRQITESIPRILGFIDRNIGSDTYGCFDRQYWHYRITDFPCARYQEAVLSLTLVYLHGETPYYHNANVLGLINAGISFWLKMQKRNGSFDEWYHNESSFVATAFTTYAISEAVLLLGKERVEKYEQVVSGLRKAGNWLLEKNEFRAANQETGAIISLYNIYLITEDKIFIDSVNKKIDLLEENQNDEGWFTEYGGADLGYLSVAIDYLAKLHKKNNNEVVFNILKKAVTYISKFIFDNGEIPGVCGSRNTDYLIPHGIEYMGNYMPEIAPFITSMRRGIENGTLPFLRNIDDRYLAFIGYTFFQAHQDATDVVDRTSREDQSKYYKKSGLAFHENNNWRLIANLNKGGAFIIEMNNKTYQDSGVILRSGNKYYFSGWLNSETENAFSNNKISCRGRLQKINQKKMSPFNKVLLNLFQSTIGRSETIALFVKDKLRDVLITDKSRSDFEFRREISLSEEQIIVVDEIFSNDLEVNEVITQAKASYIYVPSTRYYKPSDINNEMLKIIPDKSRPIKIKRVFTVNSENKIEIG